MTDSTLSAREARQRLHEIVRKDLILDKKAHKALEVGKRYLSADNGYLTRVDRETDHWEIVVTTDATDGQIPYEPERDLQKTYCRETVEDDLPLALHDAPNQGWAEDPAFETTEQHTYLGVPLITKEQPYGTVCFTAEDSRSEPFSETETRFADHLTRLLERELEKDHIKGDLTNQTNLASVLTRVLRHNLRNDISVIRGYTELMAEQLDADPTAETVFNHIDGLIDLSEKARELEEVITTNSERRSTEIGSLIEDIAEEVTREYPAVSISVEYDYDIQAGVLQNFDRAIEELLENAAKHSGDDPIVTVTIDAVPNAVEIEIRDNGPGLPDHETEVFSAGEETSLAHGSGLGLWLTYWIVTSHDGSIDSEITQYGTTMSITIPRKPAVNAQQQLPEVTRSRDKYKTAFEESSDAITIVNDDGRIIDANAAAGTLFGAKDNELLGRSLTEFLPDGFAFDAEWRDFQSMGAERDTTTILGADGAERIIEYSGTADIIPGQHLFITRDITERRERERELERYEAYLEESTDIITILDESGDIKYQSPAVERILGYEQGQLNGQNAFDLIHPDGREDAHAAFTDLLAEPGKTVTVEFRFRTAADEWRWIEVRATNKLDHEGINGVVVNNRDITERKEYERELESLKERYQTLIEAAPDPVFVADVETGEVIEVNEAAETLLGMSSDDIIGMHQAELHPSEQAGLYQRFFEEHVESGGSKRRLPDGSPISIVTASGDRVPIEISVGTVSLADGPVTYGIFRDVSEQVESE